MRYGRSIWFLGAVLLTALTSSSARAEHDDVKAAMRAALEAQLDVDPPLPELPIQAAGPTGNRGRARAAEVRARAAARWTAKHDRDEDPESARGKARAAREADKAAIESVSPATKRRAYGKGTRP